jgi:NADPH:quinone reductase-like Zn-dependent oxidoreductase
MLAIVQDRYGPPDVLVLRDVPRPPVRERHVLVRVRAASVHPDVWHVLRGRPYVLRVMGAGVRRPRNPVPGTDVSGRVELAGPGVTRFRPGDEVFGETIKGYQWHNGGAFAEYAAIHEDALALKPANVTFEQAAAVPTSGLIALHNLHEQGRLRPGQKLLVNGAGGGVGSLAVQIAKADGAEVTAVDTGAKLDMLRSLGADRVIDCTRDDFTRGGTRYDFILDIPGNRPFADCRRALTADGTYVLVGHDGYGRTGGRIFGSLGQFARLMLRTPFVPQLHRPTFSLPSKRDSMAELKALMDAGKLTPFIDRTYPLGEVPDAIRYLASGEARGKVVVTVPSPG